MSEVPNAQGPGGQPPDPAWRQPPSEVAPPQWASPEQWPAQPAQIPAGPPAPPGIEGPLPDPLFPGEAPSWQPRIIPSPPPQRGRLIVGLLIGSLAGLLVFGVSGFFIGRFTVGDSVDPQPSPSAVAATPTLPAYERSQLTLNEAKFSGELADFAEPWLPWVAACLKNGDRGGPPLNPGESLRVLCKFGGMSVYFVQYASIAERDKIRIRNLGQNVDARQIAPGVASAEQDRATPSGRSRGGYVEYAYRVGSGAAARTVSGLWWDDADRPVGAYLLAFWAEGAGENWEPMRDVWGRHA